MRLWPLAISSNVFVQNGYDYVVSFLRITHLSGHKVVFSRFKFKGTLDVLYFRSLLLF